MRTRLPSLVLVLAAALGTAAPALGEGERPKEPEHAWRADVPPGVVESDRDRARFRIDDYRDPLRSFEENASGWGLEEWEDVEGLGEPKPLEPERAEGRASDGEWAVVLPVRFPKPAVLFKRSTIGEFRYVTYDLFLPADCPGRVRAMFFLKNKDGLWFQSLSGTPYVRASDGSFSAGPSTTRLVPGEWNTIGVDLRGGGAGLAPHGNLARWQERFADETVVIGFAVYGDSEWEGDVLFDDLRGWVLADNETPKLAVRNLTFPPLAGTYSRWELECELTREFTNPFDPDEIRIDLLLTTPSGEELTIPGFFGQGFERRLTSAGEELAPVGPGSWKARFAPRETGEHLFRLRVQAGDERFVTRERAFRATDSGHPGYVRASKRDVRCFELENGEPYYPIGHNYRSPNDPRGSFVLGWPLLPDQGTFTYERALERAARGGENYVEVWLASWWVGLEWTVAWKNYHGLGRYNLANAWRLDRVLAKARDLDMRVQLVIDNHGKYSAWCDEEWAYSPYNSRNRVSGGFLSRAELFFSDKRAKDLYRRKARYIFARWGHDPTILGFELVSELDLTGSRPGFAGRRSGFGSYGAQLRTDHLWHKEMTKYFKTVDSGGRLYTTHYSGNYANVDPVMARLEGISYVVCDGYRGDGQPFAALAAATSANHVQFRKPFMVTEYGGNWNGTSEAGLEADIHSGLWGSYMTAAAGTPLLWWFEFIDKRDLYWHYGALASFARGEDRRDPELKTRKPEVERSPSGVGLKAMAYMSRKRGYAWVYAVGPMTRYPHTPLVVDRARVRFAGVEDGPWAVEFWDTVAGERFRAETIEAKGGSLEVDCPEFGNDVAMKLRRVKLLTEENAPSWKPAVPRAGRRGTPPPPGTGSFKGITNRLRPAGKRPRWETTDKRYFVHRWAVLGPFPIEGGGDSRDLYNSSLRREYVGDEARLVPRSGDEFEGRKWRLCARPGEERFDVKLDRHFPDVDRVAAYVAAELVCDREMEGVTLLASSDDVMKVYLNGEPVHTWAEPRGISPDSDSVEGLTLRKGRNLLLVKVIDFYGQWGVCARFVTRDGRALAVAP
ncbi:MAG: DUF5060 domain-containing protein [Planctomycetota bacterium]|jgi:hypothetical protein